MPLANQARLITGGLKKHWKDFLADREALVPSSGGALDPVALRKPAGQHRRARRAAGRVSIKAG